MKNQNTPKIRIRKTMLVIGLLCPSGDAIRITVSRFID